MLFLVGLGLDIKELSVRSLELLGEVDTILIETYTNRISQEYVDYIESNSGKSLQRLSRSDLEENIKETIKGAKTKSVALLVSGDPLMATTHHTILDAARQMGIKSEVLHAASIFNAVIGESGLDCYKFGQTTTIPFWTEKYKPTSFLDTIKNNMQLNAHTLLLLDYDYTKNRQLSIHDAIFQLKEAERTKQYSIITEELSILIFSDVGKMTQLSRLIKIKEISGAEKDFEGRMLTLVIPAKPSFAEEEALKKFNKV